MGLTPDMTLNMTVRELSAFARGHRRRSDADYRRSLWTAWHGGLFGRVKKLPELDKLLTKIGASRRVVKSTNQLLAMAEHLNKLFGGADNRKKD